MFILGRRFASFFQVKDYLIKLVSLEFITFISLKFSLKTNNFRVFTILRIFSNILIINFLLSTCLIAESSQKRTIFNIVHFSILFFSKNEFKKILISKIKVWKHYRVYCWKVNETKLELTSLETRPSRSDRSALLQSHGIESCRTVLLIPQTFTVTSRVHIQYLVGLRH